MARMMEAKLFSGQMVLQLFLLLLFLAAYCVQPLLVDVIKFNGGANVCRFSSGYIVAVPVHHIPPGWGCVLIQVSTFSLLIPHYYSMMVVGLLPTKKSIRECDWRKGAVVSMLDIVNQLLKKAGLLYAGAAVYIVVDSSSLVWTAVWSRLILKKKHTNLQWLAIILISVGVSLKAFQLNLTLRDEEFLGVLLILTASILMGLTFVLNEKFMTGHTPVEGPNLTCMMGVCSSAVITLWTLIWTLPKFDEMVIQPIARKGGSVHTVASCCLWLFLSGWVHSGTLWYLLSNFGAVATGILKGLKVALVFVISHFLFCHIQPSQCLNLWTATSALICVLGVILYSLASSKGTLTSEKLTELEEALP